MPNVETRIRKRLFSLQDLDYKAFQCRLMPNIDPDTVIGVRTPELRAFAKNLAKTPDAREFINILPHKYYDENNLHGFLLETIKDYDEALHAVDAFLPYIDNWATCDLISPKVFKKHLPELLVKIREWMDSGKTYTVRFGIEMLMSFYLDEAFKPEYAEMVACVKSEEYYINMMIAWYFATALAKQPEYIMPYFTECRLEKWTHNKAIQKCVESRRISKEIKDYLRSLKIK